MKRNFIFITLSCAVGMLAAVNAQAQDAQAQDAPHRQDNQILADLVYAGGLSEI